MKKMKQISYHNPVLLKESIEGLSIIPNGTYVDVTFGGGGHSRKILEMLNEEGRLFAFDTDAEAQRNQIEDDRFVLIPENFRFIKRFLRFHGVRKVDGILADLGVSSHQFNSAKRGFSTRFEGVLDMRMNQKNDLSAEKILNKYEEEQLVNILFSYGELRTARGIANSIVQSRRLKPIVTTFDLKEAISHFLPKGRENKILAQIFQAIRIEVNQELEVLKEFLQQVPTLLKEEGRLSVISYHSLEDRLVKRFIRNGLFDGEPKRDMYGNYSVPLQKVGKLIIPTQEEIKENNRARSAKLRVAKPT
jgi:16S rRNA (cytosine1402-N4)-methyltransferase